MGVVKGFFVSWSNDPPNTKIKDWNVSELQVRACFFLSMLVCTSVLVTNWMDCELWFARLLQLARSSSDLVFHTACLLGVSAIYSPPCRSTLIGDTQTNPSSRTFGRPWTRGRLQTSPGSPGPDRSTSVIFYANRSFLSAQI